MNCKDLHKILLEQENKSALFLNEEVESHLQKCNKCRFLADYYLIGFNKYLLHNETVSSLFYDNLMRKFNVQKKTNNTKLNKGLLILSGLAASIVFAIIIGYFLGNSKSFLYSQNTKQITNNIDNEYITLMSNHDFTENYLNLLSDE